jgi:hypothetical protein
VLLLASLPGCVIKQLVNVVQVWLQDIQMCALVLPSPTLWDLCVNITWFQFLSWKSGCCMRVIADQNSSRFVCQLWHSKAKIKESMMGLDQSCLNWMIFCNVPCSSCRLGHSWVGMVILCKENLVSSAGDYDVLASSGL